MRRWQWWCNAAFVRGIVGGFGGATFLIVPCVHLQDAVPCCGCVRNAGCIFLRHVAMRFVCAILGCFFLCRVATWFAHAILGFAGGFAVGCQHCAVFIMPCVQF